MHVHFEGGGVLCNILSSACLYFFPSQLLLSCIYSQFIPSFSSSGSNDTIYVGFAARYLLVSKNKEAKCQILLTFHGLLLLKNRRGRETTARLVGFSRQGLELGWPALLKRRQKWQKKSGRNEHPELSSVTWGRGAKCQSGRAV